MPNPVACSYIESINRPCVCVRVFAAAIGSSLIIACTGNGKGSIPQTPAILASPASCTVSVGQVATFAVTAEGAEPLTYQWAWNGCPVQGATESTYSTNPAISADNDSVFTVAVTNSEVR